MAGEEEIKKPWPSGYLEAKSVEDFDFFMTGKDNEPLTKVPTSRLAEVIGVVGESMMAIQGGSTVATAVELPDGPVGKNRFFDASWGYWKYNNVVLKNPNNVDGIPQGSEGTLYWNGTTETWSISKVQALLQASADGNIAQGDLNAVNGDKTFKAINPIEKSLNGDYFKSSIDFTNLTTSSGGASTFINLVPVTVKGPLNDLTVKANIGVTITPVVYTVSGANGSYTFTLLKEYPAYVMQTANDTIAITDTFEVPVGSYVGIKSSNNVFNGSYTGVNMVRVGNLSHNVNTAIAYNYSIKTGSPGALRELQQATTELANAPFQPIYTKNKYNRSDILEGNWMSTSGVFSVDPNFFVTGFIPVKPGAKYKVSVTARHYAFFDSAKNYNVIGSDLLSVGGVLTVPSNSAIAYVRISIPVASTVSRNLQIEEGITTTGYRPYGLTTLIKETALQQHPLYNKVVVSFGDSNDALERWQYFVLKYIPMVFFNRGVGGTLLSSDAPNQMANLTRLQNIPTCDILELNGGMNDWRNNIPIGSLNDTVPGTLLGGLYTIIKYVSENRPMTRLYVKTINFARLPSTGFKNAGGFTTQDYSDAMVTLCKKYNIPVIDLSKLGFNEYNYKNFIDLDPNGEEVHINLLGGERVGQEVINVIS
jgi:hypothetical protein